MALGLIATPFYDDWWDWTSPIVNLKVSRYTAYLLADDNNFVELSFKLNDRDAIVSQLRAEQLVKLEDESMIGFSLEDPFTVQQVVIMRRIVGTGYVAKSMSHNATANCHKPESINVLPTWIFKFVNLQLVVSTTPCDGMADTMTVVSNKIDATKWYVNIAPRKEIFGRKVDHPKLSQYSISLLERWHLTPRHAFGLSYQPSGLEDKVHWRPKHHARNNEQLISQQTLFSSKYDYQDHVLHTLNRKCNDLSRWLRAKFIWPVLRQNK